MENKELLCKRKNYISDVPSKGCHGEQKCLKFSSKDVSRGNSSSFLLDLFRSRRGVENWTRAYLVVKELLNSLPLIKSELKIIKLKLALEFSWRSFVSIADRRYVASLAVATGSKQKIFLDLLWLWLVAGLDMALDPNKGVFGARTRVSLLHVYPVEERSLCFQPRTKRWLFVAKA